MHGLILADSYGIPNQWVRFGDRIIGGEYKYKDYYSTTDNYSPRCISLASASEAKEIISNLDEMRINRYEADLDKLLNAFPADF